MTGDELRRIREALGMSQTAFGAAIQPDDPITRHWIGTLENRPEDVTDSIADAAIALYERTATKATSEEREKEFRSSFNDLLYGYGAFSSYDKAKGMLLITIPAEKKRNGAEIKAQAAFYL